MKTDSNWKETRVLANDIESLIGIPCKVSEEYLTIVENLIIHKLLEKVLEDDNKDNDYCIELPYLGSLVIYFKEDGGVSINFSARNSFKNKLKEMYISKESPLTKQVIDTLSKELLNRLDGDIEDE